MFGLGTIINTGVDMSTPAPVNSALEIFGELITELEQLVER